MRKRPGPTETTRMVNGRGGLAQRTFSFVMRLLVSLILPAWGLAMIVLGARSAAGHRRRGAADWCHFLCRQFANHALFAGRSRIRLGLRALIRPIRLLYSTAPGRARIAPRT